MSDEREGQIKAIARLEIQVEHLTEAVADLKAANANLSDKLDGIQSLLTQARGGWRTVMWAGGAVSALGAAIGWFSAHFTWKG